MWGGGVSRRPGGGYRGTFGSENGSHYRGVSQLHSHQSRYSVQLRHCGLTESFKGELQEQGAHNISFMCSFGMLGALCVKDPELNRAKASQEMP